MNRVRSFMWLWVGGVFEGDVYCIDLVDADDIIEF